LGDAGGAFNSISWLYLLGAAFTLYSVVKYRSELARPHLTPRGRQLLSGVAFLLLVPVGVLLHEFGHMLAAWSTGSTVLGLHYFLYWGYVEYIPSSASALLEWYVALAGNFMSYLLGIACMAAALVVRNMRPFFRSTLMQLGILEIVQTLIFYPLISLLPDFHGDWDSIYSFRAPVASTLTALIHVISLAIFVVLMQRNQQARYLAGTPAA